MSRLGWYLHRLRAMGAAEIAGHIRKKVRQRQDRNWNPDRHVFDASQVTTFPIPPACDEAPSELSVALAADIDRILGGDWRAFGHCPLQVDDPPRWHKDYRANVDVTSEASSFRLNHRELPNEADIKLIWELSRWYELVRLAQAAYVLENKLAAQTCIRWLHDWQLKNPPFQGWNWTSALESGMRLIQFTWIDALLVQSPFNLQQELEQLRKVILPAHTWFTWRYKSFGSSANNHLLGELVGLIVAQARWPELFKHCTTLEDLQKRFEAEVLAQFAEDGGNKEQALNYQLFSFEFCWQAQLALQSAGKQISLQVRDRLQRAAEFFLTVQSETDFWDYGDSDSAFVTPFFAKNALPEWRNWLRNSKGGEVLTYWLGKPPELKESAQHISPEWSIYPKTRIAVHNSQRWMLRFDLSPLGYLSTAAHGHLDALHLSIWLDEVAFIVDPGTGAYYADKELRSHLASWDAHNAPHPPELDFPKRLGPFLWSQHHSLPGWKFDNNALDASLELPTTTLKRTIRKLENGWLVKDSCLSGKDFIVNWQFAPGTSLKQTEPRAFSAERKGRRMQLRLSEHWNKFEILEGKVSPAFRKVDQGPMLRLSASEVDASKSFETVFISPNQ